MSDQSFFQQFLHKSYLIHIWKTWLLGIVASLIITGMLMLIFFGAIAINGLMIALACATPASYHILRVQAKARLAIEAKNEELLKLNDLLKARNDELDAYAHTVAHDLKNPLSILMGYAGLLVDSERFNISEATQQDYAEKIRKGAVKMREIIDTLLIMSQLRRDMEVKTEALNMEKVILAALGRVENLVVENSVEIEVQKDFPFAQGYAPWVEEIWANYISNAIKYGGKPPRIEIGSTQQENGTVRFWIKDNGKGMTEEERAGLFGEFERLAQHSKIEGHGLGLSIVRRIAEKLNGEVGCESTVGQGSTFYFTLPSQNNSSL